MPDRQQLILRVATAVPVRHCVDYLSNKESTRDLLKPGIRLEIPFGKTKTRIGILLETTGKSDFKINKLKTITNIIDDRPLFPNEHMKLLRWASDYYHYPIGEVIFTTIPTLLRRGKPAKRKDSFTWKLSKAGEKIDYEFINNPINTESLITLNSDQLKAVEAVNKNIDQHQRFLLEGVTGSGKTEVYLEIIKHVVDNGKQALILVPEIGLTPQLINRISNSIKSSLVVLHSALSDRERLQAWLEARDGIASVILGTRSAIWTPLKNPGVFIVDEEHDISYKQQDGFRYSARDVAIMRAKMANLPVVLGSATPSRGKTTSV